MKVKLIEIKKATKKEKPFIDLLEQVPYPVIVELEEEGYVCLKQYITDPLHPGSEEEWSITWFEYEEVEEVEN